LNTTIGANVIATPAATQIYSVTGTSTAGCTGTQTVQVTINPLPSGFATPVNSTCGNNNGQIIISNTSGPGQTVSGFSVNNVATPTQTVINLAAGGYTITMVNNFGCTASFTTSITNTPPITALATTFTNATCGNNNGAIG